MISGACPVCFGKLKFISRYGRASEFYKCTGHCKRLWDFIQEDNIHIDVFLMLSKIAKENYAS